MTIRRLAAQHAATRALVEAEDVPDAFDRVVRAVVVALGWDVGVAWFARHDGSALDPVAFYASRPVSGFERATRALSPLPGEGLPGRVWRSGEPAWITDVATDPNFPRRDAALAAGLKAAFAFPVRIGTRIAGVLEFLSAQSDAPDAVLLDTMAAIGQQIGLFVRRREAEARLREQEERYRLITETSPDAVIVIDSASRIRSVNPAVERIFGWRPEELMGRPLTVLMSPDMATRHEDGIRHFIRTGERRVDWSGVQLPGRRRDGTTVALEISFGTFVVEGDRLFTGIVRDVSDRVEQQHRLEESTAELEATVEELESQRWEADEARREAEAAREEAMTSERWSRFVAGAGRALATSLDRDETLRTLAHLAVPAIADVCIADVVEENGDVRRVDVACADGISAEKAREYEQGLASSAAALGPAHVIGTGEAQLVADVAEADIAAQAVEGLKEAGVASLLVVPLIARGRTVGAITMLTADSARHYDASDLTTVEALAGRAALAMDNAALYEQALAANRAKGNFLAIMSHELRTPLTAIMGYTDILTAGIAGDLEERQRAYLDRVMVSARHLLQLIDEILTFSRLEIGRERTQVQKVPLQEFAQATANLVKPAMLEKQLTFEVHLPEEDAVVETDPEKVRQVLLDILFNAVKFTSDGKVVFSARMENGSVRFDVTDTGIGIEGVDLARIFEPFWQAEDAMTRREGGTGMGLSVARRLTNLLGGDIEVHSTPGQGTAVSVRIPLHPPQTEVVTAPEDGQPGPAQVATAPEDGEPGSGESAA